MENEHTGTPRLKKILIAVFGGLAVAAVLVFAVLFVAVQRNLKNHGDDFGGLSSARLSSNDSSASFSNPVSYSSSSYGAAANKGVAMMEVTPSSAPDAPTLPVADRKVMRSGAFSIRVADADAMVGEIRDIAKVRGGFVTDVSLYGGVRGNKSGTLTVSVPSDRFDDTMAEIKKKASLVVTETVSGNDVTEAYVDLTARIGNKRAEEQAYAGLLEKAEKMSDIIELTQALSKVRGDIESMEGQKRYYDSRTTMATITVSLSEDVTTPIPVSDGFRPWQAVKDSAHTLALFLEDFLLGMIKFVIVLIPVLLLLGLVAFLIVLAGFQVIRRLWKRFFSPENRQ